MLIGGGYTEGLQPKAVRGEVLNEADNGLKNVRGTVAMNRYPEARNSGTCQFIINLGDNAFLDQKGTEKEEEFGYCVFGKVIRGMDVIDKIAAVATHTNGAFPNTPVEPVVIQSIRRLK